MKNKKYVVDTNILISRLLLPDSIPARVVRYILDNERIVMSDYILEELSLVLFRQKFDQYVSTEARSLFIEGLKILSFHVEITDQVKICRDPKDDKILEAAISSDADIIITGDDDLLSLEQFRNIKIITAKYFYDNTICNTKEAH